MSDQGDTRGNAPAANQSAAPAEDAYKSAVDLASLDAEAEAEAKKAEAEAGKNDDDTTKSSDTDEDADDATEADGDADEDEDQDDGDEDADEGDDEDKPRKRSRSQRYQTQIQRLQEENARLRGRASGSLTDAQVDSKVQELIGAPPQETDYPDYLAWERAATAYELDKRQVSREVKAYAAQAKVQIDTNNVERAERHRERVDDFRERGTTKEEKAANAADFDKVMAAANGLKASPTVEDLVLDSRRSGHLVYYFAKNPDRLEAINRMTERDAAREIGRIEARLSLPKPKTKTSAPNPPKGLPRGGAAVASQDADLDSYLTRTYGR